MGTFQIVSIDVFVPGETSKMERFAEIVNN